MKKKMLLLMTLLIFSPIMVKAGNTYLINSKASVSKSCTIKTEPNEKGAYVVPGVIHFLDPNDQVTLVDGVSPVKSTNAKCSSSYYYVSYVGNKGYVCGDYISFDYQGKYDQEFQNAGFPQSYWLSLNALKENHPNWKFTAYATNINWEEATKAESSLEYNSSSKKWWSRSYIASTNPLYLSKSEGSYNSASKKFNMMETGGWYAANQATVAYYMDPRNFLNDRDIFMFESGYFNKNRQTKSSLTALFKDNAHKDYVNDFYEAATAGGNNINPIMLGARSRLEVGGTKLSNAANGTRGYYNFYNIGSFSSCSNPVACGNNFASGKGWTSARTAIIGGAAFIDSHYIQREQKTIYFQKFNTAKNDYRYANQYMTNIQAPKNEANLMYNAYLNSGTLNQTTEFFIPVYNNMPGTISSLPTKEESEPSNGSSTNTPSYDDIPTVISKSGYVIYNSYIKNVSNGTTTSNISSKLKAKGNVNVSIANKAISTNQTLVTGDIIHINNGLKTLSYKVVVKGDVNGDGKISAADYMKIKNHIMGTRLGDIYAQASDVNNDGRTSAADYMKIKNYIMGSGTI